MSQGTAAANTGFCFTHDGTELLYNCRLYYQIFLFIAEEAQVYLAFSLLFVVEQ